MGIRVALVTPYTLPFMCGNSLLAERLRRGLSARGYEVGLFDSGTDGPEQAAGFKPQVLHSLNAERPARFVRQLLAETPVPWIITLTGTDYAGWAGVSDPPPLIKRPLEEAGLIVVFHDEARAAISRSLPSAARKLRVVSQAVEPAAGALDRRHLRRALGIGSEDMVFLMVSSVRPVKNLLAIVPAFEAVRALLPRATLLLIGPVIDGEEGRRLFALTGNLDGFRYLGEKRPEEVLGYMAAADVFVNTSISEGMAGAVLEAMAEGLPVLASNVSGNRALVEEGETGLLFALQDPGGLVQLMLKLASDGSLRKRLGRKGREVAATRFGTAREIDGYDSVYKELMNPAAGTQA